MSHNIVKLLSQLSDGSMRNGEEHLDRKCKIQQVPCLLNERTLAFASVRKCRCERYKDKSDALVYTNVEVPQDGIDMHVHENCKYEITETFDKKGKRIFKIELVCYCHQNRSRRPGEMNEP
ncbi:hypothetical protein KP79_PYT20683 [Mizuhopecten yessoensis]|uniref:Uncharacterized protein n=1 Tax=Mizuhopecten yessoensis TaxID=6573 RepID=A0A210QK33_MIZYE|nr:hypothetical protein KP79_PYT20683 [Mizuhopecten yessoensis]